MRSRFKPVAFLAAAALVMAACGGGGEGAPQAAGVVPNPVPFDDSDFDFLEDVQRAADLAASAETATALLALADFEFDSDLERAATLVLTPADLAADYPGLTIDPVNTDERSNLEDLRTQVVKTEDLEYQPVDDRITGYTSLLVTQQKTESAEPMGGAVLVKGDPNPHLSGIYTTVHVYENTKAAADRVAHERRLFEDNALAAVEVASVEDVPALPGEAFIAELVHTGVAGASDDSHSVEVWFAQGDVVGVVDIVGVSAGVDAVEIAQELSLRVYRADNGRLPVRDPYPRSSTYNVPHQVLDRFNATAKLVISDEDGKLVWFRATGTFEGRDRFSCRIVEGEPGSEQMILDMVVSGNDTEFWVPDTADKLDTATETALVASQLWLCPAATTAWRTVAVRDLSVLTEGRASTPVGPATSYLTEDINALSAGLAWSITEGEELVRYIDFVHEDGYLAGTDWAIWFPRSTIEAALGVDLGIASRVLVEFHVDIHDPNGEGVAVQDLLTFTGIGELSVQE